MNRLIQTISLQNCPSAPVWFMRQAGRYLPEYQMTRKIASNLGMSFIDLCHNSKFATEISLQPLYRFDIDAVIVFSDILIVLDALGSEIKFGGKEKIKITHKDGFYANVKKYNSIRSAGDNIEQIANKLNNCGFDIGKKLTSTGNTISSIKKTLALNNKDSCVIGFCGSPVTVSAYAMQCGKVNEEIKQNIISKQEEMLEMINIIVDVSKVYLSHQIENGADIIKLFDSHAGFATISEDIYDKMVIKPNNEILQFIRRKYQQTKTIVFPKGSGYFYEYSQQLDADCIAIDSSVDLQSAKLLQEKLYKKNKIIQGNLDNFLFCYGSENAIRQQTIKILDTLSARPFIFNLGHGILQHTDYTKVDKLIKIVREYAK